jgi:hypothetical protein
MGKRGREEAKMLEGETKGFTLSQAECGTPGSEKLPSCGEVRRRCGRRGGAPQGAIGSQGGVPQGATGSQAR